ncbi:porin family protein [Alcanivorax sp.]|uniref:porin family protein n=1 Tax=Alcanivorax sp. TaxID=1872427 RepID=UPI000C3C3374|nr:porin family protein [Alcanivorax sp.]MBU85977.1 hypothetical protein [Alcanivorax sp.]|tara:strand:+ start:404 stop:940 length:537 start_codon:yes stop_codon:yes gene_type:complete
MRKLCASLVLCGIGLVSANANAEGYIALGYAQLDHSDRSFTDGEFDTGNLVARLGADISPYFGAELRLGTTVVKHEETFRGADVEYKQDYFYGAYLRVKWDNTTSLTPYAALGVAGGRERLDSNVISGRDNWNDVSYAAGVDMDLTDRIGINAEYTQYRDDEYDISIDGPSVSAVWKF